MMSEMCIQVITFFLKLSITDRFNNVCPVSLPNGSSDTLVLMSLALAQASHLARLYGYNLQKQTREKITASHRSKVAVAS